MRMAEASNDCSLPEEIVIIEILPRLPVKSLLRFRSVCKSWLTQISNPNFTKLHLDRSANKTPLSLIAYSYIAVRNIPNFASGVPLISLIHLDSLENTPSSSVVNLDQPPLLIRADLVGSYNGIVCLGDEDFICLWNPATRQYKHLPPPLYVSNNSYIYDLGFSFDSVWSDCKVVRIGHEYDSPPLVEVYSANADSWRKIEAQLLVGLDYLSYGTTVKGFQYWYDGYMSVLLSFDVHNEVFSSIALPYIEESVKTHNRGILEFMDSVAIFVRPYFEESNKWCRKLSKGCSLWTMDDDFGGKRSWTKKFSFNIFPKMQIFAFMETGEIVVNRNGNGLFLYDPKTKLRKNVGISTRMTVPVVLNHIESLVSIKGSKQVPSKAKEETSNEVKKEEPC